MTALRRSADDSAAVQRLASLQRAADARLGNAPAQRKTSAAAEAAAPALIESLPKLVGKGMHASPQAAKGDDPIQGVWFLPVGGFLAREFAKGAAEGALFEGGKDAAISHIGEIIDGAGVIIDKAVAEAMQNPELREQIGRLADMSAVTNAARDFAVTNAAAVARMVSEQVRPLLPEMPQLPDFMPQIITAARQRLAERFRESYLYNGFLVAKETASRFVQAAFIAGLVEQGTEMARRYLSQIGADTVRASARAAVEPAIGSVKETADQIKGAVENLPDVPIYLNPAKKAGRYVGRSAYRGVAGPADNPMDRIGDVDALGEQAINQAGSTASNEISEGVGGSGADYARYMRYAMLAYQVGEGANRLANAKTTEGRLNAVSTTALTIAMPHIARTGAAYAAPMLAPFVPVGVAPFLPAMITAGLIASGGYLGYQALHAASSGAAPYLESFGQTTIGTPFRKGGQLAHLGASAINLPLVALTSWLPFVGSGKKGISDAYKILGQSFWDLMGWTTPEEEAQDEPQSAALVPYQGPHDPGPSNDRRGPPPSGSGAMVPSGPRSHGSGFDKSMFLGGMPFGDMLTGGLPFPNMLLARGIMAGLAPGLGMIGPQPPSMGSIPRPLSGLGGQPDPATLLAPPLLVAILINLESLHRKPDAPIGSAFPVLFRLQQLQSGPKNAPKSGSGPTMEEVRGRFLRLQSQTSTLGGLIRTEETEKVELMLRGVGVRKDLPRLEAPPQGGSSKIEEID